MNREIYRYTFNTSMSPDEIESTLLLAVLAAESLHGKSCVRLDASYCFDAEKRTCVINACTDVGYDVCRLFTGLAIREYGEDAFKVQRVERAPKIKAHARQ